MPPKISKEERIDNLAKGRATAEANKQARIDEYGSARRTPMQVYQENPTRTKAINAMCYSCNGEENYVSRTRFCQIFDCPLWKFRPYSKGITQEQCNEYEEG